MTETEVESWSLTNTDDNEGTEMWMYMYHHYHMSVTIDQGWRDGSVGKIFAVQGGRVPQHPCEKSELAACACNLSM